MPQPTAGLQSAPQSYSERSPIGEVTVLVFGWEAGQTEVRIRFPESALGSASEAVKDRERFRDLILREVGNGLNTLGWPSSH
jgi:hypothetical protein